MYGAVRLGQARGAVVIEVAIRPRANRPLTCAGCEQPGPGYDTLAPRRFEFVPLWGIPVFFLYAMRRVQCRTCGVRVEAVPWASGKHHLTTTYAWFLARWAKRLSWTEVAAAFCTTWEHVFRSVEMAVTWGQAHRDLTGITAIGIDEIQWRRGHTYLTLVYQLDAGGKTLALARRASDTEDPAALLPLAGPGPQCRPAVHLQRHVEPYLRVVAKKAGHARHILDRFHIMSHMSKAIDEVRATEARALKARGARLC